MFNFTTTTLIHSLDQFVANPTNVSAGQTATSAMLNPSKNTLWVNGVNLFKKENVVAIYRNPYVAPLAGRLIVDINEIWTKLTHTVQGVNGSKVHIRLKFSLRRSGDNNSYYARDEVFKGKDFVYEWIMTQTTTVADIAKQIKKINRLYGDIYLDVHVGTTKDDNVLKKYDTLDGSAFGESSLDEVSEVTEVNKLVFVNDNYGLFTDATLEYWQDGISDCCHYVDGGWIPFDQIECKDAICVENCSSKDCDVMTRGIKESTLGLLHIVDCVNGTGTYQQILRDLRLPTMENLGYMSLTQQMNEMPIPGMNYVQYTLHYVTCRGILGGSAVGEVTHSKTTHVFFVPATCCNCEGANIVDVDAAFLAALNEAFGWKPCGDGRLVAAPHDDPTIAPSFKGQLAPAKVDETRTNNDTNPGASESTATNTTNPGGGDVPGTIENDVSAEDEVSAEDSDKTPKP